jgi:serine/threonine protein kinase
MTLVNPDFAPIELLSTFSSYGPESDVYGLAAVAYMALTGKRPTPAAHRAANPRLAPAHALKPGVPSDISDAIDRAMRLRASERTPTMQAFLVELGLSPR